MNTQWQALYHGARIATMESGGPSYGAMEDAAIAVSGERIVWIGKTRDLPGKPEELALTSTDLRGRWVTPGWIDCAAQLVHGGEGATAYESYILAGRGANDPEPPPYEPQLMRIVRESRATEDEDLFERTTHRLGTMIAEGTTTVEILTGHGLDGEHELRALRVIKGLDYVFPLDVRAGYFGARAVPEEFAGRGGAYADFLRTKVLEPARREELLDAVILRLGIDGLDVETLDRLAAECSEADLPIRFHCDELETLFRIQDAASSAANSILFNQAGWQACDALARSGNVALLAPARYLMRRLPTTPPISLLRNAGVPIALTTGYSPDLAPCLSPLIAMTLGVALFGLTPEEALAGMTREAARALGLQDDRGTLAAGKRADFVVWDVPNPASLAFRLGGNPCIGVIKDGLPMIPIRMMPDPRSV